MRGVSIGQNVSIGLSALIESAYPRLVSIGDNVTIGMRAVIIGHLRDSTAQARILDRPTVRLEDNVYLGPGVIVLPNVTIGHGAVVSAGSVVTHSVPPQDARAGQSCQAGCPLRCVAGRRRALRAIPAPAHANQGLTIMESPVDSVDLDPVSRKLWGDERWRRPAASAVAMPDVRRRRASRRFRGARHRHTAM